MQSRLNKDSFTNKTLKINGLILLMFMALPINAIGSYLYTYTGNPFTYSGNTDPSNLAYSNSNNVEFSFVSDVLLQPTTIITIPTDWYFSDGTQTYTSSDGVTFDQFYLTPSSTLGVVFDDWYIDISPACTGCGYAQTIQTRNQGAGLIGDWGQNYLGNYGGNWNSPGLWNITSTVPEPPVIALLSIGLLGFVWKTRRG